MKNKLKQIITFFFVAFLVTGFLHESGFAMTQPIGINGQPLLKKEERTRFSFIAMGHIYGSHDFAPQSYDRSPYTPSTRLLHNLDKLKEMSPDFVVSLGDMITKFDEENLYMLERTFLKEFDVPIFNSVGAHDIPREGEERYKEKFGEVSYFFEHGSSLFIILNSQNLEYEAFEEGLALLEENDSILNIFICMHQLKFLAKDDRFEHVLKNSNAGETFEHDSIFADRFLPALKKLSDKYQIYILGGDVGADVEWSYSIFYHKDGNMHYVATGLGDTVNDAVLRFDVRGKSVNIVPISLDGQELKDISYYGVDFWKYYFSPIGKIYRKTKFNLKYIVAGFIAGVNLMLLPLAIVYFRKTIK